jgi:hypothetical protein
MAPYSRPPEFTDSRTAALFSSGGFMIHSRVTEPVNEDRADSAYSIAGHYAASNSIVPFRIDTKA